jgi:tripartite-type tricarboxylate transporter receptor subunit TctC
VQPLVAQGLNGVVVTSWVAAMLPPKTPRPIVVAWRDALQKSMDDAGVRQKLQDAGIQVQWQEAEPLAAMLQADLAKWRKVIATAKITAN